MLVPVPVSLLAVLSSANTVPLCSPEMYEDDSAYAENLEGVFYELRRGVTTVQIED